MERTITWKSHGWPAPFLGALLLATTGCGSDSALTVDKPPAVDVTTSAPAKNQNDVPSAPTFITQFLDSLNSGEISPDVFTLGFKKWIARPQNPNAPKPQIPDDDDDAPAGYSKKKLDEYLRRIGGTYESKFEFYEAAGGPYVLGNVKTKNGRTEQYLIHLVPAEQTGWQVDWFQRSPVFISYVAKSNPELVGAEMAVHRFMTNLLGGDVSLAEATLSKEWKVTNYPSNTPSEADLRYSRGLVRQKLDGWKGDYPAYDITERKAVAGGQSEFEVVVLDAQKKPQKIYELTVKKEPSGDWVVDKVDVK